MQEMQVQKGLSDAVLIKIVESIKDVVIALIEQKCQPLSYRE